MELREFLTNRVKSVLKEGLKACNLSYIPYSIIKETLKSFGYTVSEDTEYEEDVMYTNSWKHDYHMYIWKDNKYTGYYLYGSLYYGTNAIEKD